MLSSEQKGSLAITQIVLLTIGIIVVAIVIWVLYTQTMSGTSAIDANKCTAEKLRICTMCKFGGDPKACNPSSNKIAEFCSGTTLPIDCVAQNILPK